MTGCFRYANLSSISQATPLILNDAARESMSLTDSSRSWWCLVS